MTQTVETRASAPPRRALRGLRRWGPWVLLLILAAVVGGLLSTPTSTGLLEPANRGRDGGAALAQVLQTQGVQVDVVEGSSRLMEGSAPVGPETTVLLPHTAYLGPDGGAALLETLAPVDRLVVLVPSPEQAPQLGLDVDVDWIARGPLAADCTTDEVHREDVLSTTDAQLAAGGAERGQVEACFPPGAGHNLGGAREGALLTWPATAQRPETVVATTSTAWTNARITEESNAALALRLLGGSERLVWVLPQPGDAGLDAPAGLWDVLPRHLTSWVWLLGAAVLALALWQGRRLGPVVVEPLPAVVPAGETTRSRGRLYRQARDREHALAAIRAGTRRRLAPLLGLPPASDQDRLVAAVAEATGRSATEVAALLAQAGPVTTDDALVTGARALHELEEQVRTATRGTLG
ncbi:DUF4350 domain-containing protein [Ornithinimicrobium pratense]|uniref:DUF4350 domain-containing protein n=1 Tax=Ornithinimicrobium pratense TaxID=2593973 RepID=A0A5J6V7L8_9MICO|nr:DUF4350 domain-containing protein [Ornithinimicrobium pratense]QFG69106.1 DUF4350 domain-containing protein [Ornithinimicrobium pratense]